MAAGNMTFEIQRRRHEANHLPLSHSNAEAPRISRADLPIGTGGLQTQVERPNTSKQLLDEPARAEGRSVGRIGIGDRSRIESIDRGESDRHTLRDLLLIADVNNSGGEPIRFQIGEQSFTPAQLLLELERDPHHFDDFLRANHLSIGTLAQVTDDVVLAGPQPGAVFDLRQNSELHAYYTERDSGAIEERALVLPNLTEQLQIEDGEELEGPGFFEMIGEAFAEFAGAIARLFGSSWNPDTVTFDGRIDDEQFKRQGRALAEGDRALALRAQLSSPDGEASLRNALERQRPENATETQWSRAVSGVIAGMREAIAAREQAGTLPEGVTPEQNQRALIYLRANQYSPQAYAEVTRVLSQPESIRDRATQLMNELPDFERANMFALFAQPQAPSEIASDAEWEAHFARSEFQQTAPDEQRAIFESLANDGFSRDLSSGSVSQMMTAVRAVRDLPPEMREDYLALVPRVGLDRMQLLTDQRDGLVPQMTPELFGEFNRHLGNTRDLEALLTGSGFDLRLSAPRTAPITEDRERRTVLNALALRNVSLNYEGGQLDVGRYFSDASYRRGVLESLAAEEPVTRQTLERIRGRFDTMLRNVAASLGDVRANSDNLSLEVSGGSELHAIFGLSGERGPSAENQLARRQILASWNTVTATLPVRNGAPQTLDSVDLAQILNAQDPAAELAARHPGLDLTETVAAFSQLLQLAQDNRLPGQDAETISPQVTVDLTQRTGSRAVDRIAQRLRDGVRDNVGYATGLTATVRSRAEFTPSDPSVLVNDASLNAVAGNNWFQYGIFTRGEGTFASRFAHERARTAFQASGNTPNISHPINALFDVENYRHAHNRIGMMELGLGHGRASNVLVDEQSGRAARPEDFQVLAFVGRGMGLAGRRDAARVEEMFERFGGVPPSQVETHNNPTPDQMYDAIRAEIMRDPRENFLGAEVPARTVVVYYSGHTVSNRDDNSVLGLGLRGGELNPLQIRELNTLAQQRGVNMLWNTDACRSGEYVDNAGDIDLQDRTAARELPATVEHLAGLRLALMEQHQSLTAIRSSRSHEPSWRELAELGARAMREGAISPELQEARDVSPDAAQYVAALETAIEHRDALAAGGEVDPGLLANAFLRGERAWEPTRRFSSFVLGDLADRIAREMNTR